MPKIAMDYSRTIIYKIVCNDVNVKDLYVGSTTNFIQRKNQHKSNCNNITTKHYNYYVYDFIRNNGGWDNFNMVIIEKYPCNDRLEASQRERFWIETLNANLNKIIPLRTFKEYCEDNKSKIQEQTKNYYKTNKSKILEQIKIYRENNKSKIKEQRQNYYETNKSKMQEKNQIYRETNKLKISEKQKVKITCDICNCKVNKCNIPRHNKSIKHQNYENNKLNILEKQKVKTNCDVCNCEITRNNIPRHNKTIKHQKNLLMNQQENDNS
jgi:hypothetical protein